ncbi:MAG: hypothetical protein H7Z41_05490 [Cytophagales bacterium]|nr:hypothetical protein [Armatimonadota bacterium]
MERNAMYRRNRHHPYRAERGSAVSRRAHALRALTAASFATLLAGCGGGSETGSPLVSSPVATVTPAPTPTPTPTPVPPASVSPSREQTQAAVNGATAAITLTTQALEPLGYLSEGDATRSRQSGSSRPQVTVTRGGGDGITVTIDFGTGTTGAGGVTRSGSVSVNYNRTGRSGLVTFGSYTVNGQAVSGTLSLTQLTITSQDVSYIADADLAFPGVGTLQGSLTCGLSGDGVALSTGSVTVTGEGQPPLSASVSGLIVRPSASGNFVPNAGSVTVIYPYTLPLGAAATATIAITFTDQSPVSGAVQVSVNGGSQVLYTLPGF